MTAPRLLQGIDLLGQLRGDVVPRGNKGAGLGSGADLHGCLAGAGSRQDRGYAIETRRHSPLFGNRPPDPTAWIHRAYTAPPWSGDRPAHAAANT